MDTKLFLRYAKAVCDGICTTQTMTRMFKEATPLVDSLSRDEIHDLELACLMLNEYIKKNRGAFCLQNAVAELVNKLNNKGKAIETTGLYDSSFSTTRLIRGGKDILWVAPKI